MVNYRKERKINFLNLDEKPEEYSLINKERLLDIKCPLDQTFLVQGPGYFDPLIKCPKCGLFYDNHDLSPENLQLQLNFYLKGFKIKLKQVENERSNLIKILNFAYSRSYLYKNS